MAIQRNVQQQAAETLAAIRRADSVGRSLPPWLGFLLQQQGLASQPGVLVSHCVIPEQEGHLQTGLWLTESLEFWAFEVMVSRDHQQPLCMEALANVTASFPIVASLPGTGPSFGHLARQVLLETRAA